jgi:hypothetical protein
MQLERVVPGLADKRRRLEQSNVRIYQFSRHDTRRSDAGRQKATAYWIWK